MDELQASYRKLQSELKNKQEIHDNELKEKDRQISFTTNKYNDLKNVHEKTKCAYETVKL